MAVQALQNLGITDAQTEELANTREARPYLQVRAPADGVVVFTGLNGGLGRIVRIAHGLGYTTVYGHLDTIKVEPGEEVRRGAKIGTVGNSGRSTGPHLHYEYRVKGVHKNPASIPLPNTEIPSRYVAEFRSQAEVALAQLRVANSVPGERLADNR